MLLPNNEQNLEECPDAAHKHNPGSVTMQTSDDSSNAIGFIIKRFITFPDHLISYPLPGITNMIFLFAGLKYQDITVRNSNSNEGNISLTGSPDAI